MDEIKTPGISVLGSLTIVLAVLWLMTSPVGRFLDDSIRYLFNITILIAGVGVLMRRKWGRVLYLGSMVCGLACIAIPLIYFNSIDDIKAKIAGPILFWVALVLFFPIWYFTRPAVKSQFK